jgi:hypothetical protein
VGQGDELHVHRRQGVDVARLACKCLDCGEQGGARGLGGGARGAGAGRGWARGGEGAGPAGLAGCSPMQKSRRGPRRRPPAAMDSSDGSLTSMPNGKEARNWRDCLSRISSSTSRIVTAFSSAASWTPLMIAFASTTVTRTSLVSSKVGARGCAPAWGAPDLAMLAQDAMLAYSVEQPSTGRSHAGGAALQQPPQGARQVRSRAGSPPERALGGSYSWPSTLTNVPCGSQTGVPQARLATLAAPL